MNYSQAKRDYDQNGFAVVRNFLTGDELAALQAQLDRYILEVVPTLDDAKAFYHDRARPETLKQMQYMQGDAFFCEYVNHPKWKALAEALVGEEARCESPEWFNKPPGVEHPTPAHQDNYYFNLTPPNVATIWLALDVVDDENGCLRYVAGSHRNGFRQHGRSNVLGFSQGILDYGPADEAGEVKVHLRPGDVVAHNGMTIHRAEPNRSPDRNRRAFAMVYKGVSCRRDEAAFARYQASAKAQHELLGLKTT